jgi:hypothetical protein
MTLYYRVYCFVARRYSSTQPTASSIISLLSPSHRPSTTLQPGFPPLRSFFRAFVFCLSASFHDEPPHPHNSTPSCPLPNCRIRWQVAEQRAVRVCPALEEAKRRGLVACWYALVHRHYWLRSRMWGLDVTARMDWRRSGGEF